MWIALFILDVLVIVFGEKITSFLLYPKYYDIVSNICNKLLPFNIFLFIFLTVKAVIKHYNLPKINLKVSKGDNEMSLGLDTKDIIEPTSLDSNLNEIIYLMERLQRRHTSSLVLVIEDLDRYPADICIPILVKFNQINVMLNQRYRQRYRDKKKFKFMYVLRDDIFYEDSRKTILQKDPYKFFDILLPIIPKLYFGNSAKFFKSLFNDIDINKVFIDLVSPFLDDYRKIHNVKNEFIVYYNSFEKKCFDMNIRNNTALLAFIMYKVFFPAKYYELRYIDENGHPKSKLWDELRNKDITHNRKDSLQLDDILKVYMQLDVLLIVMNINLRFINLYEEYLRESNLMKVDLTGANLGKANLIYANLIYANLTRANLTGANLTGANLTGVNLTGANLTGANLISANLTEANLTGANLTGANLISANLTEANLTKANLMGASLIRVDLTKADLKGANLIGAQFINNFICLDLPLELKNVILLDNDLLQFDEYIFNGKLVIINPIIYKTELDKKGNYIPYDMDKYKYNPKTNRMELKSNQSIGELLKK